MTWQDSLGCSDVQPGISPPLFVVKKAQSGYSWLSLPRTANQLASHFELNSGRRLE